MLRVTKILAEAGVHHFLVKAAKPYETLEPLNKLMDKYVDAVVKFLRGLAKSEKRVGDMASFTYEDLGLHDAELKKIFGKLRITLFAPVTIEPGSGLPLGGNLRDPKNMYRGGYYHNNPGTKFDKTIVLPYIEPKTGKVMPIRVESFHCTQLIAHETQHYLDWNGFNPELEDVGKLESEHELSDWYSKETEFNAVVREITQSVRRLLQLIEQDQKLSKPKFKKEKIANLFGKQFQDEKVFLRGVLESMLQLRTDLSVFEFGKHSHCAEVARRYQGGRGLYRFRDEFDKRLHELWRYVIDWYRRVDHIHKFSKAK